MAGKITVRNAANNDMPIVALLGWGNGQLRHLLKYSDIFETQGFCTVCLTGSLMHMYLRPEKLSTTYRKKVIRTLEDLVKDNQAREIFLMAFSQTGANVMASIMTYLENSQSQMFNIVGTIFDSCPILFDKSAVISAQRAVWSHRGPPSKLTRSFVNGSIRRVVEHQVTKNPFIMSFDSTISEYSSLAPQLFLCSRADRIVDYKNVVEISRKRQEKGVSIYMKIWDDCEHVGMLRKHHDEYADIVRNFVKICLEQGCQHESHNVTRSCKEQRWIVELV